MEGREEEKEEGNGNGRGYRVSILRSRIRCVFGGNASPDRLAIDYGNHNNFSLIVVIMF